ncbi:hypothetical protein DM02DRAFT_613122 [Periconia macrospinosa]|uniref:Calcineurin-like phosphoesterase domain-containing protein n=1 Tax=Periconia macrospinosa TaxID=97972 RepID=A0A2V1DVM5_9PLEO|nr:hypothetical protein DM02DRAFT_613122 [Periconia macrospinosa]
MQFSRLLLTLALLLAPVALLGTTWLYLYPFFDRRCSFPTPPDASIAPFRLLALGDPQLEGDTSLPKPGALISPSLNFAVGNVSSALRAGNYTQGWEILRDGVREERLVQKSALEGVKWIWGKRKWIDLWGNDWYLGHIVRTLRWWTEPSHVAVLGDLLGSQWIKDEEFERRQRRYWDVVMKGMEKVPNHIMTGYEDKMEEEIQEDGVVKEDGETEQSEEQDQTSTEEPEKKWGGTREVLGADPRWKDRVINIAGNHDIGYAGDIDESRVERFERAFGKVNWDIVFTYPLNQTNTTSQEDSPKLPRTVPELRLVVLNSMNLDTPVWTPSLQEDSYDFMNHVVATARPVTSKTHTTLLLTHIPFHKEPGICVDSPLFTYFEGGSGVKEQNMLSDYASRVILEGIFGLNSNPAADGQGFGRHGIVLNGHDHAGCDVLHWIEQPGATPACPHDVTLDQITIPQFPAALDIEVLASSSNDTESALTNNTIPTASDDQHPPPSPPETETETETASSDNQPHSDEQEKEQEEEEEEEEDNKEPIFQSLRYPPSTPYTTSSQTNNCIPLESVPRMREITLRSMMGDYAGYAGFLSAWYEFPSSSSSSSSSPDNGQEDGENDEEGQWHFAFNTCGLGTQHWWWAVHVVDLICVVFAVVGAVLHALFGSEEKKKVRVPSSSRGTVEKKVKGKQNGKKWLKEKGK